MAAHKQYFMFETYKRVKTATGVDKTVKAAVKILQFRHIPDDPSQDMQCLWDAEYQNAGVSYMDPRCNIFNTDKLKGQESNPL